MIPKRLWCWIVGHDMAKVVLGVGRARHFYRCTRCGATIHRPDPDE